MNSDERDASARSAFAPLLRLDEARADCFVAPAGPEKDGRTFGGLFLAQALVAAQRTVGDDREVHSLHAYFLRAGAIGAALDLEVERVRDGRSFSQRLVRALQQDKEMFRMVLSFHVPEPGQDYARRQMPDVPAPDEITFTYNDFNQQQSPHLDAPWEGAARPMDIRYINPPTAPEGEPVLEDQRMWMRIAERLGDDQNDHDAGLAYLSDSTLVDHVVLPHGQRWQDPRLNGASLDHAMWFHRRARADQRLLFDQSVEATGGARGLATGRFFDEAGKLIATYAQEGLIRW